MTTTPRPEWAPPADANPPVDGWNNNAIARSARSVMLWGVGILVGGWVALVILARIPTPETQTYSILLGWLTLVAACLVALVAIVLASIGLYRASKLGGYRNGTAIAALLGGIATIALGAPISLVVWMTAHI